MFKVCKSCSDLSVEHAGLIGGHHVFDIYEGVFSPVALKHLQSLLDQVAHVLPSVLAVVDTVSGVNWGREQVGCRQRGLSKLWSFHSLQQANGIFPSDFKNQEKDGLDLFSSSHGLGRQWGPGSF